MCFRHKLVTFDKSRKNWFHLQILKYSAQKTTNLKFTVKALLYDLRPVSLNHTQTQSMLPMWTRRHDCCLVVSKIEEKIPVVFSQPGSQLEKKVSRRIVLKEDLSQDLAASMEERCHALRSMKLCFCFSSFTLGEWKIAWASRFRILLVPGASSLGGISLSLPRISTSFFFLKPCI